MMHRSPKRFRAAAAACLPGPAAVRGRVRQAPAASCGGRQPCQIPDPHQVVHRLFGVRL